MAASKRILRKVKCPICAAPAVEHYKPFCSKRCADIDLGKWLTGGYAIPGRSDDPMDEDASDAGDRDDRGDD